MPDDTPLRATDLAGLHPRLQIDTLRKALRGNRVQEATVRAELDPWIELFGANPDPGFRVLVLELVAGVEDPRIVDLARTALDDPGDGVRLEGLRILLDHDAGELAALDRRLRDDDSLEVRLLLAERLHAHDPAAAVDRILDICTEEALGPREGHALERGIEFLVESASRAGLDARLRSLKDEVRDPEGYVDWGLEQLAKKEQA